MVHKLVTLLYLPEDEIIRQSETGGHFFFLAKGDCDIWVKDHKRRDRFVRLIKPGMLFGEVALITKGKRTATVRSRNYCTAAALTAEQFHELCEEFPEVYSKMKLNMTKYQDRMKLFMKDLLLRIDFCHALSLFTQEELVYTLVQQHVVPGGWVLRYG